MENKSIAFHGATEMKIKILIACFETITLYGILKILSRRKDLIVVGSAKDEDEILLNAEILDPDILFLCSHLVIERGIGLIKKIKEKIKRTKLVIFNSRFPDDIELLLVREGVDGILEGDLSPDIIPQALRKIAGGEIWVRRRFLPQLITNKAPDTQKLDGLLLTGREKEVLSLISTGFKNPEISSRLCLSSKTVKTHINNIYKKLKTKNRTEAMLYAKRRIL